MKLVISDVITNVLGVETFTTKLTINDFDVGAGKIPFSLFTAKGDILAATGSAAADNLAVGTDGQSLVADSTSALGVSWQTPSAGESISLTNTSGLARSAGEVVILDTSADESFTTTVVPQDTRLAGVLAEDIAATYEGKVSRTGQHTVLVTGNVSRGMWLITSATAGRAKAAGYAKPAVGGIGIAITEYAGGGSGSVVAVLAVETNNGASSGNGYSMGGMQTTTVKSTICKLTGASETTANTASALTAARSGGYGVSSSDSGFSISGSTTNSDSTQVVTADKIVFATDAVSATTTANLAGTQRYKGDCGAGGTTKGYIRGGLTTAGAANGAADKVTYATAVTASQASANCTTASFFHKAIVSSLETISMGGSNGAANITTADKVLLSTDTSSVVAAAALSAARFGPAGGVSSSIAGYIAGGNNGSDVTTADKCTFATLTTAVCATAALSAVRRLGTGSSLPLAGYVMGGMPSGSMTTIVDKVAYATDTTSVLAGAALPEAIAYQLGGLSVAV